MVHDGGHSAARTEILVHTAPLLVASSMPPVLSLDLVKPENLKKRKVCNLFACSHGAKSSSWNPVHWSRFPGARGVCKRTTSRQRPRAEGFPPRPLVPRGFLVPLCQSPSPFPMQICVLVDDYCGGVEWATCRQEAELDRGIINPPRSLHLPQVKLQALFWHWMQVNLRARSGLSSAGARVCGREGVWGGGAPADADLLLDQLHCQVKQPQECCAFLPDWHLQGNSPPAISCHSTCRTKR